MSSLPCVCYPRNNSVLVERGCLCVLFRHQASTAQHSADIEDLLGTSLGSFGSSLSGASAARRVTSIARVAHSRSVDMPLCFFLSMSMFLCGFFWALLPELHQPSHSAPYHRAQVWRFRVLLILELVTPMWTCCGCWKLEGKSGERTRKK